MDPCGSQQGGRAERARGGHVELDSTRRLTPGTPEGSGHACVTGARQGDHEGGGGNDRKQEAIHGIKI